MSRWVALSSIGGGFEDGAILSVRRSVACGGGGGGGDGRVMKDVLYDWQ